MTERFPSTPCPYCGTKLVTYRHALNKGLVSVLRKINATPNGRALIAELELTNSQYSNYPKLAYWKLARQIHAEGKTKGGPWEITDHGRRFLRGQVSIPKAMYILQGRIVDHGSELVSIALVDAEYRQREEYAEDARPLAEDLLQRSLFNDQNERQEETNP